MSLLIPQTAFVARKAALEAEAEAKLDTAERLQEMRDIPLAEFMALLHERLAEQNDGFDIPGSERLVDDHGNRVGQASWVPRAEAMDIPEYVWQRIPEPAGWRVCVQELRMPELVKGIWRADVSKDYHDAANFVGRVVAIGPSCFRHPKFQIIDDVGQLVLPNPWCKPGQWVNFARFTGTPRSIEHERSNWRFRYVFDENINSRAPTPAGLRVYGTAQ